MKLQCVVEVHNRSMPLLSYSTRKKPQQSCLAIGRQSVKENDLYILLQTQQNKQGTKYKVDGNIETVFAKFIHEGKVTLRMIQPPHDLIIQSNAIQLKSFIRILKMGLSKKIDLAVLGVSNLTPKALVVKQKKKIVISKNSDYPTLQGFPKTTEELFLIGLNRKSFDRQILYLQSLRVLNLSDNQLSSLPKELGTLPHLQELLLAQNLLGKSKVSKWSWLDQLKIRENLRFLDISCNLLRVLPDQIGKLNSLVNLKVNQNMLTYLPQSIGNLCNLKYLEVAKNSLCHLPGSMRNLKLLLIDISENPFLKNEYYGIHWVRLLSLVECAAKVFLKTRQPYDATVIPLTLVKYLDGAKYCACGNACFNTYMRKSVEYNLTTISNSIKSSGNIFVPFDCYFCSANCRQRFSGL